MLYRDHTTREKILLGVLAFLIVAALYYFLCYRPCKAVMTKYDTAEISSELTIEQNKATKTRQMKENIKSNKTRGIGVVMPYNNIRAEVSQLNSILSRASSVDISYDNPVKKGNTVRRHVNISFTCGTVNDAKSIISDLNQCGSRCVITGVQITTAESSCNCNVDLTFIETSVHATSLAGLSGSSSGDGGNTYTQG